jgi:hypothetical protein
MPFLVSQYSSTSILLLLLLYLLLATAVLIEGATLDGEKMLGQWKLRVFRQKECAYRKAFSNDPFGSCYTLQILGNGTFALFPEKTKLKTLLNEYGRCNNTNSGSAFKQPNESGKIHGTWKLR